MKIKQYPTELNKFLKIDNVSGSIIFSEASNTVLFENI